jgi:hypothetical protein
MWIGSPLKKIWPSLGRCTPATIWIRVDFPAPFSPNSTWTSPARTSKLTRSSASVPGNCFEMRSRRSSTGTPEASAPGVPASSRSIASATRSVRRQTLSRR